MHLPSGGLASGLLLSLSDCSLLANPPLRPITAAVHNSPSWSPSILPAGSLWATQHSSSCHSLWCSVYTGLLPDSSLLLLHFAQSNLALAFPSVVRHHTGSFNARECISSLQKVQLKLHTIQGRDGMLLIPQYRKKSPPQSPGNNPSSCNLMISLRLFHTYLGTWQFCYLDVSTEILILSYYSYRCKIYLTYRIWHTIWHITCTYLMAIAIIIIIHHHQYNTYHIGTSAFYLPCLHCSLIHQGL